MVLDLPSARRFHPAFYSGGATRFYLPLFYDIVTISRPKLVVTLGFGDGQPYFTFCQAARENNLECRSIGVRRSIRGENPNDDETWVKALAEADEFYGNSATLMAGSPRDIAQQYAAGSVDVLLISDCDASEVIRTEFAAWQPKLAANAVVLFHGIDLERTDPPRDAWTEISTGGRAAELHAGIGLGLLLKRDGAITDAPLFSRLFGTDLDRQQLADSYEVVVQRIDAECRASQAKRHNAELQTRLIWMDSLLEEARAKRELIEHQQRHIDHQQRHIEHQERQLAYERECVQVLRHGEAQSRLAIETQTAHRAQTAAELETVRVERDRLRGKLEQLKNRKLPAAQTPQPPKSSRARVLRELARVPRNIRRFFTGERRQ
jgi:hypothetical protein